MGGALRKTMVYLGLAEDDERYEAYDAEEDVGYDHDDEVAEEAYGEPHRPEPRPEARVEARVEERRAAVTPIGRAHMTRVVASSGPVARVPSCHVYHRQVSVRAPTAPPSVAPPLPSSMGKRPCRRSTRCRPCCTWWCSSSSWRSSCASSSTGSSTSLATGVPAA